MAEYGAMSSTAKEVLWLRQILMDFGVSMSAPTPIYCDNQSAIKITANLVFHKRTKHLEVALHFVRHNYLVGSILLPYVIYTQ